MAPLVVLAALLGSCQAGERAIAPSVDEPQLNRSSDDDGDDGDENRPGGTIAFHSTRDGDFEVFVMNADGTQQTQLTRNTTHEFDPTWSPDGRRITFTSVPEDFDFSKAEIFVMNADGTGLRQLTHNNDVDFGPVWSPDGKRVAFTRFSFSDNRADVFLMNADGSQVRRLTNDGMVGLATAWSPDGKRIAFTSFRDGHDLEFFVIKVGGGRVTQLTNNDVHDEGDHAGWSPDGKLFVFSRWRRPPNPATQDPGGDLDVWVMNADGTRARQLTNDVGTHSDDPFWSPDGEHIAFHSDRDGDEEIYVMRADGRRVKQLTHNDVNTTGQLVGPIADGVPAWTKRQVLDRRHDGEGGDGSGDRD